MRRTHFANGKPCTCEQRFSDSPSAYVANHPNKRGPFGETFADEVSASIKERSK